MASVVPLEDYSRDALIEAGRKYADDNWDIFTSLLRNGVHAKCIDHATLFSVVHQIVAELRIPVGDGTDVAEAIWNDYD